MKVGIVIIATGKYDRFIAPLLNSLATFLPQYSKVVYLFNDKEEGVGWYNDIVINRIKVEHQPFPYPTLMRYKWIASIGTIVNTDYLFYSDVDMRMVNVGEEVLQSLVAVLHPGFYQGGGSWETNHNSLAYIEPEKRKKYYAGGFQGGWSGNYLRAAKYMSNNIQQDLDKGVVAVWHDESHWNKYLTENTFTELTPSHCYPEGAALPFEQKIIALNKNHNEVRL